MKINEIVITEMPRSSSFDLTALNNDVTNREQYNIISSSPNLRFKENRYNRELVYCYFSDNLHVFSLINKKTMLIDYISNFEDFPHTVLGNLIHQQTVWKRKMIDDKNIAAHVFDTYFMTFKDNSGVISSNNQTADGRDFWLKRMEHFYNNGNKVGVLDTNSNVITYITDLFSEWKEKNSNMYYGDNISHEKYRYFILK